MMETMKEIIEAAIASLEEQKKYDLNNSSVHKYEKELESLTKEKDRLEASIIRREKLLSNENYVNKAPANIVELDRKKLAEEKEKLELLKNN